MFLENLTRTERSAFLILARKLVHADGILREREEQVLSFLADVSDETETEGSLDDVAAAFATRRAKVSALLELIGIGLIDGDYHSRERVVVAEAARALGFRESELLEMETWVARQVALLDDAAQFWAEADR